MRSSVLSMAILTGLALGGTLLARAPQALQVPSSIQAEHHEIHEALVALIKATGPVGAAAKELAATLHPHFVREDEIALPPLGLLAALGPASLPTASKKRWSCRTP